MTENTREASDSDGTEGSDATLAADNDLHQSVMDVLRQTMGLKSQIGLRDVPDGSSPLHKPLQTDSCDIPAQISRYRVAGEIARGGVGSVVKARDEDLGRDVALKLLLDRHSARPDMTQRFVEEAQIAGQLQHPGIVPIHELGLVGGTRPYIAMKLVKGQTLARLLENRRDVTEERQRFLGIFEQICQPLAYAHARGVIHRDLKPSNVMVGAFGEVQVMDWGFAKVLSRSEDPNRKQSKVSEEVSIIETLRTESGFGFARGIRGRYASLYVAGAGARRDRQRGRAQRRLRIGCNPLPDSDWFTTLYRNVYRGDTSTGETRLPV